jgi:hypothetical protein
MGDVDSRIGGVHFLLHPLFRPALFLAGPQELLSMSYPQFASPLSMLIRLRRLQIGKMQHSIASFASTRWRCKLASSLKSYFGRIHNLHIVDML